MIANKSCYGCREISRSIYLSLHTKSISIRCYMVANKTCYDCRRFFSVSIYLIILYLSIYQVLHGCQQDVLWLQRDFSVYLVNVFDTHQAGKILGFPR